MGESIDKLIDQLIDQTTDLLINQTIKSIDQSIDQINQHRKSIKRLINGIDCQANTRRGRRLRFAQNTARNRGGVGCLQVFYSLDSRW